MVLPKAPLAIQFGEDSTTIKGYAEETTSRMRAPPRDVAS